MKDYVSFQGTVTELITPFTAEGKVDYELLQGETEGQIKAGIAGLFTNGLASEALSLTPEELVETTKKVVEVSKGRVPVMGNIACNTLVDAYQVLRGYEKIGVDAVCIQQPSVYACSQASLQDYFSEISRATALPVGIYNAPQTGNTLAPQTVANLFHQNPNMCYYKESTIDLVHIQTTMRLIGEDKKIDFLSGSDASTLVIMLLGGHGVVSLISAVFPKSVMALTDAVAAGNLVAAKNAQRFILEIRDALKSGPFVAGYKYASELAGIPLGAMRKPLGELTAEEKTKIKNNLVKLDLV